MTVCEKLIKGMISRVVRGDAEGDRGEERRSGASREPLRRDVMIEKLA